MKQQIRVVNKYRDPVITEGWYRRYVGRPSVLGNPFAIEGHLTREDVIAMYQMWFYTQLAEREWKSPFIQALWNLRQIEKLELECYCAPKACHADLIKEFLESIPEHGDVYGRTV